MISDFDPRRHLVWGRGGRSAVSRNGAVGQPFLQLIEALDPVRSRHTAIFGGTGTGKTTLIEAWLMVDIWRRLSGRSDRGFVVVDVIGDLTRNMLCRIAAMRAGLDTEQRRRIDRLISVVDPRTKPLAPAYDLFDLKPGETPEKRAGNKSSSPPFLAPNAPL